ncbi:MAG: GNAT family N-acetyltransferase [Flavobacteriales bacterium]|jgi:ribosomal protein S18 acetylase RimI-like enzyme|nr:GNAT family N-acetyltransferase [Flavobacteriales bacterium]
MDPIQIERAVAADIPFLVEVVEAADRGIGAYGGLARVFGLKDEQLPERIEAMFQEEVDGCEFSVSSFLVARSGGKAVAAVGGWVEGAEEEIPSQMLRSNLIGFTFPPASMEALKASAPVLSSMRIDRKMGDLQIEYVYVVPSYRGQGIAARLIQEHITVAGSVTPTPRTAQVQVFSNNAPAIRLYTSLGFRVASTFRSEHPRILELLPHHEKIVMELELP